MGGSEIFRKSSFNAVRVMVGAAAPKIFCFRSLVSFSDRPDSGLRGGAPALGNAEGWRKGCISRQGIAGPLVRGFQFPEGRFQVLGAARFQPGRWMDMQRMAGRVKPFSDVVPLGVGILHGFRQISDRWRRAPEETPQPGPSSNGSGADSENPYRTPLRSLPPFRGKSGKPAGRDRMKSGPGTPACPFRGECA